MTQTTLLVVLAAILTGGVLVYNTQRHAAGADDRLEEQQYKSFARDAAEAGLNVVVRALAESHPMGSWNDTDFDIAATNYHGGRFRADVQLADGTGDLVDVVVRGLHRDGRASIFARYEREKDDVGVPPAFRNVITTQLDIDVRGRMLVDAISDEWNASIHTNRILDLSGQSFRVEGYGTYWNDGDPLTFSEGELARFDPNIDYNGDDPNVFQSDGPIEIPSIDPEGLLDAAATSGAYRAGTLTINNAVIDFTNPASPFWAAHGLTYTCAVPPCGTAENPFVLYITGATLFSGTTTVVGHGVIFVDSDITVSGNLYGTISAESQTQLLLATTEDILVPNNTCLGLGPRNYRDGGTWNNNSCVSSDATSYSHGLSMYAEGQVQFGGTPFIVGGIVSPNADFLGHGNPWIAYAAPSETIVDPGFEYLVPIGPILVSYSEW